jgi:drug/metabolite transporter (DMT)-like permease
MTICAAFGALFFKKASGFSSVYNLLKDVNLYIGCLLYLITVSVNIYLLRFLDYSVVLPLSSVTYVWILFLSQRFLNEKLTARKLFSITGIVIGAVLVSL